MWSAGELEALIIWADELQARGDAWGELVATSMAARASEDPEHARHLSERLVELEHEVLDARVGPLLADVEGLHPVWEHGALVSLRVCSRRPDAIDRLLERTAALLRLPAARFLWSLRVELHDANFVDTSLERLPEILLDPEVVARPRVLMLGSPPRRVALHVPLHQQHRMAKRGVFGGAERLAAPERGLHTLLIGSSRIELPFAKGDGGTRRQAFARLDARIRGRKHALAPADRCSLGRALYDRSLRVRLGALDCLASLGVEAAPLVPDLVLLGQDNGESRVRALEVAARLAEQPEVVACVAENFVAEQIAVVEWMQRAGPLSKVAVARIEAMTRANGLPGWIEWELRQAIGLARPVPPPDMVEPRKSGWVDRLRSWLRR